jgi:predicted nucleic acid-binding protein
VSEALIVDTGGWLAALSGHEPYAESLEEAGRLIVPGLVLAELDYFLRRRRDRMHVILQEIAGGSYDFEPPTREDLGRARSIDRKFMDLELGLVDASVAALAERIGVRRVLTIDSHFAVIRIGPKYQTALEIVGGPVR